MVEIEKKIWLSVTYTEMILANMITSNHRGIFNQKIMLKIFTESMFERLMQMKVPLEIMLLTY